MKIPYQWLKDFLPTSASVETVADILTLAGLEVDGVLGTSFRFKGVITAGPVLPGNDLYVVACAADGKTELGRDESVEAGGAYEFSLVKGYTGTVILRVYSRSSAVPDYMDEALLAPSNLSTVISAVALISQGMAEKIVNVNMVTDLAARMAGVKTVTSGVSESANVVAINQAMSKAVGLGSDEIINYTPSTTVDVNGKTNPNPNLIGYLLDWISHTALDSLGGDVEKVQQKLLENLTLAGGVVTVNGGMQDGIRQSQTMTAATSPKLTISDSEPGTAKSAVLFILNFSEAVSDFDLSKISITGGTASGFKQVSASQYTVVVTPTASSTTDIVLTVAAGSVRDLAGNALASEVKATQPVNTVFGPNNPAPAADTVAPTLVISDSEPGTAKGPVLFTLNFMVIVTHKPGTLALVNRIIVVAGSAIVMDGPRDAVLQQLQQRSQPQA
ncbi:MAG: hypothetical protein EBT45_06840, partial [Alphaproteobacteria bacterium]|nr:hypothetical protein [Alphaproteobacteria bacterium]